jgi:hypothetical protein
MSVLTVVKKIQKRILNTLTWIATRPLHSLQESTACFPALMNQEMYGNVPLKINGSACFALEEFDG